MILKSGRAVSREFCLKKSMCPHWTNFIWLAEGVAKILRSAKLVFCLPCCLTSAYNRGLKLKLVRGPNENL